MKRKRFSVFANRIPGINRELRETHFVQGVGRHFHCLKSTELFLHQACVLISLNFQGLIKGSELCEQLVTSSGVAGQLVDRLEKSMLVEGIAGTTDHRVRKMIAHKGTNDLCRTTSHLANAG